MSDKLEWEPIETAPTGERVWIIDESGDVHTAAQVRPNKWRDAYEATVWRPTHWARPVLPGAHEHRFLTDEEGTVWPCACGAAYSEPSR